MTDVSEMGEQWSPKSPPPSAAAIATDESIPIWFDIGTAIAIIIANVPHDVPVEKEIKQHNSFTISKIMETFVKYRGNHRGIKNRGIFVSIA